MKQHKFTLPALLALAIVACQQPADDSNIAIDNGTVPTSDVETLPADDGSASATEAGASGPMNDAAAASLPKQVPASLRGRWGINSADCTSTKGDAKGLLTITDAGLAFYESRGTIDQVIAATANSFDARYAFTGEGQTWQRTERMKIVDGQLQRRTDAEPGQEPPVNLRYQRCSAGPI